MLQSGGWKVCANDWGLFSVGNDLADHHIWPMEVRLLYAPALGFIPDDQAPPPPCPSSVAVMFIGGHTTSYPNLLLQKLWLLILVSFRKIRSKPQISTARMDCAIPDPRLLCMLRIPRDSSWRPVFLWRSGGGDVWRRSHPWLIIWVRHMDILVGSLKTMYHINLCRIYGWSGSVT